MKATYQASEIYLMSADGSGSQKITTLDRDPGGILWARDGSGVYFSVAREGTSNVYFAAATGSAIAVTTGRTWWARPRSRGRALAPV